MNIDGQIFDIHVNEDTEENPNQVTAKPMDPIISKIMEHEGINAANIFNMAAHTCRIGNEESPATCNEDG